MAKITKRDNLPPASNPWAREVTDAVNSIDVKIDRYINDQTNRNRASASNGQILTSNNLTLAQQVAYLQSLKTVSTQGSDFLIDNVPGDQTYRWYTGDGSTQVTVDAPTGRLLVSWGCGSVEIRSGSSTMYAAVRIRLSSPSGWTTTLGAVTRVFVTANTILGVPFATERTFDNVPADEPITVQTEFGVWSAGTTTLGAASFLTPYVRAQVVPAA